jgi:quinol-cytochrome oxidoreductase complex cytochrome b subunit
VHYWSANLVILMVTLHLLRVFLTGGFHGPRQFNWVIGLCLLGCVLLSNFTGYLLPWDQLSYWAITICTAMLSYVPLVGEWLQLAIRGGDEIGGRTIIVFYALHTTISPVLIVGLMAFHFWRVRKAGGVVLPPSSSSPPGPPRYVLFIPNLLLRETVVALVLIALVFLAAVVAGAPLGERANPGLSPNPAKAPWYFLGLQELLLHFHPVVAVLVLPLLAVIALMSIPYLRYETELAGAWFLTMRGKRMARMAAVLALVVTAGWIVLDEFAVDLGALTPAPPWLTEGVAPCALLIAVLVGFYAWVKRRHAATRNEAVQALFIFVAVAFAVLTVTGIWFRGEGMALAWPWAAIAP